MTPHDLDAERHLLGAMLLGSTPIIAALPIVTAADFYRPAHASLFTAIVDLHANGVEANLVTVRDHLRASDQLESAGGDELITGVMRSVPSTSAAASYATVVANLRAARRLIDVGGQISELGRQAGDIGDALDTARTLLGEVEVAEATLPAGLVGLDDFLDRPASARSPWVVPGLMRQDWRAVVVAAEGTGKRLRVDEPIPTPDGWTTMGLLAPGDRVFDMHGVPCNVVAVSDVEANPDSWAVDFDDGTTIQADADHQWVTVNYQSRQRDHATAVVTTADIRDTIQARGGHTVNHAVPVAGPLELNDVDLPIPPYTLGVWLGDGTTISGGLTLNRLDAPSIEAGLAADGFVFRHAPSTSRPGSVGGTILGLSVTLRAEGLLGHKTIPDAYLRGSRAQRLALLRGLMDTDGYVSEGGHATGRGVGASSCELTFTCKTLIPPTLELIRSLGIRVHVAESDAVLEGRVVGRRWRMTFQAPFNPFSTPRKATRWAPPRTRRSQYRYIVEVRPVDPSPMRCISVDSPTRTYLAGEQMVPTHNSMSLRQIAMLPAQGVHPFSFDPVPRITSLIIDLENPDDGIEHGCSMIRSPALRGNYERNRTYLWSHRQGLNLRTRSDRALMDRVVGHVRPDLVVMGPLNKMFQRGRDTDEQAASEVQAVLDDLRTRHRFGLIIEHHAPKGQSGMTREMVPFGSQRWQSWPELGVTLRPDGEFGDVKVGRFRGDRLPAAWPDVLQRGGKGSYPWQGYWSAGMPMDGAA